MWALLLFGWLAALAAAPASRAAQEVVLVSTDRLAVGEAHACVLDSEDRISCRAYDTGRELDAPTGQFHSISAAGASTCALREDGTATCWSRFKLVDLEPPNREFLDVTAAGERACGVRRTGRIECWGATAVGQPPTGSFLAISADTQHACALSADGTVACWDFSGPEWCDQEDGRITACSGGWAGGRARPPYDLRFDEYDERFGAVSISSGRQRSCAILETGNVTCWGDGWWLGTPPPEDVRFKSVSAGDSISCGITEQNELACWGQVIGTPLQEPDGEYVAVAAGTRIVCAIRADDDLKCWQDPQLGAAAYPNARDKFRVVSAGGAAVCGITLADYRLLCWNSAPNPRSWPAAPPDGRYRSVAVASQHACALTSNGEIRCWETSTGEEVAGPDGTFETISAGVDDACALSVDGQAACWSFDAAESRIGDPPDGAFTEVTVGREHACALDVSGRISCWGSDEYGQSTPPSGAYRTISAGDLHTCAVSMNGRVECWGSNTFGQIDYRDFEPVDAGFHTTCGRRYGNIVCSGLHWNTLNMSTDSRGYRMISTGRGVVCVIHLGRPQDHEVECRYAPPDEE